MEWEADNRYHKHTYTGQGCRSPGRCSSWEMEFRDCGAMPGLGLLLTVEIQMEGMWGRRLVGNACREKPGSHGSKAMLLSRVWGVEPSPQPLSPHTSIGSWTVERLAHQTLMHSTTEQDPARCPFKCLMCWPAEWDPSRGGGALYVSDTPNSREEAQAGSPLSAWMGGATEKDWPKRPSDRQLPGVWKKTPIGP